MFEIIQGERMKKIVLSLSLVMFVFTGCFMIFDDDDDKTKHKDDCSTTYDSYGHCRDYQNKKSNIRQTTITPAKKSNTPDPDSKIIHRKK